MIYAIHAEGTEFVKIGIANGPNGRLSTLQCGCPLKLVLLASADWHHGIERHIHRYLGTHNVRGEWFMMVPPVLDCIEDMRAGKVWRVVARRNAAPSRLSKILTESDKIVQSGNSDSLLVKHEEFAHIIDSARKGLKNHYVQSLHVPRLGEVVTSDS